MKDVIKKIFGSKLTEKSVHEYSYIDNCTAVVENGSVILAVPDPIPLDLSADTFNCYNMDKIGNNTEVKVGYIKPTIEQMYSSVGKFINHVSDTNDKINRDTQVDNLDNSES